MDVLTALSWSSFARERSGEPSERSRVLHIGERKRESLAVRRTLMVGHRGYLLVVGIVPADLSNGRRPGRSVKLASHDVLVRLASKG